MGASAVDKKIDIFWCFENKRALLLAAVKGFVIITEDDAMTHRCQASHQNLACLVMQEATFKTAC